MKLSGLVRSSLPSLALVLLAAVVAGCDDTPVTPSSPAYSLTDLRVGTGEEATASSTITVTYTGWFYDVNKSDNKGLVFDTTVGRDPLTFTLGTGSVISGWEQGLPGMKVGGARRLILPPSLGYGSARYASVPPNATLIFDIELVSISVPPTVTAVDPASGTTSGGASVTVTGTGFVSGATVIFGGVEATNITWVSSTSITATTPAHVAGAVDVVVVNPVGLAGTLAGGFTYVAPAPTVTAVGPASGTTSGGTAVTITGTGFVSGATVLFGGIAATNVTWVSSTSITATTPALAAGAVDVVVANPDGLTGTLATGYTYVTPTSAQGAR